MGCPYIKFAQLQKKIYDSSKKQTTIRKIGKISASIRGDTTFAQAVASGREGRPPPQRMIPTWTPPSQDTEAIIQPGEHPQYQERQQTTPQPPWVADLKKEIAEIVSSQFNILASKVAENAHKIEFILNTLHTK